MKATFLSTLVLCIYWGWVPVLIAHVYLNHHIFSSIGKEEVEKRMWGDDRWDGMLLCLFTFSWSKDYQKDEDSLIRKMMKTSNILSIVLIIYTIAVCILWLFTHGKKL